MAYFSSGRRVSCPCSGATDWPTRRFGKLPRRGGRRPLAPITPRWPGYDSLPAPSPRTSRQSSKAPCGACDGDFPPRGPRAPFFCLALRLKGLSRPLADPPFSNGPQAFRGRTARPKAQSVAARTCLGGAAAGSRLALHRVGGQREERAVGKFQIPAKDLHFVAGSAFADAPAFDDKLGSDRKAAGQTV